ncbi:MAG: hypothetical protein JWP89_861 [Schlesneria sp.]|nr:hypothetical protein [Schlesneria sp.]
MNEAEVEKVIEIVLRKLGLNANRVTPEYYSIEDAAMLVSMPEAHIKHAVLSGALLASNLGSSGSPLYRISRENVMQWLNDHKVIPVPVSRHHLPKSHRPKRPGT